MTFADSQARKVTGNLPVGALQKDKQVYEDIRGLLSDLRKHPWKVLWKE